MELPACSSSLGSITLCPLSGRTRSEERRLAIDVAVMDLHCREMQNFTTIIRKLFDGGKRRSGAEAERAAGSGLVTRRDPTGLG